MYVYISNNRFFCPVILFINKFHHVTETSSNDDVFAFSTWRLTIITRGKPRWWNEIVSNVDLTPQINQVFHSKLKQIADNSTTSILQTVNQQTNRWSLTVMSCKPWFWHNELHYAVFIFFLHDIDVLSSRASPHSYRWERNCHPHNVSKHDNFNIMPCAGKHQNAEDCGYRHSLSRLYVLNQLNNCL